MQGCRFSVLQKPTITAGMFLDCTVCAALGRMILELAGPGDSKANSKTGASAWVHGTQWCHSCDPPTPITAVRGHVDRLGICGLLTWVVQRMEACVKTFSPYSLRIDCLLYPVSHPPPRFPGTKISPCEVQTTGDLFEILLPSGLNV